MRRVAWVLTILVGGVAIGVLTVLGQKWLDGGWLAIVNSGAVWLVPAFAVGARSRSDLTAAAAGTAILVVAVLAYYGSVPILVPGASSSSRSVAIWVATSLVGGPMYGIAGHWWRTSRSWRAWAGIGLLAGAFLAEGLARLRARHYDAAGLTMVAIGMAVPLILGRSARERVFGLLAEGPVVVFTAGAYAVINWAFLHS